VIDYSSGKALPVQQFAAFSVQKWDKFPHCPVLHSGIKSGVSNNQELDFEFGPRHLSRLI
jgi:hypothetical protein